MDAVAINETSSSDPSDIRGLEGDEEGRRVVREELRLLAAVKGALDDAARAQLEKKAAQAREDSRLLELRDEVAEAKPDDLPALFEQMHHVGALRAQRGKGAVGIIDQGSPYFGHLRLEENGKRRDVLVGTNSYVDTSAGVRIVDWRNAPVSRIFYRYQEGDDYEERLGDRVVEGNVLARRGVAIHGGELVRIASPQGTFIKAAEGWKRVQTSRAQLRTEKRVTENKDSANSSLQIAPKLGIGADGAVREDKHLPAIAALLDKAQFELITKPGAGLVAIQGSAGSGKTTVGLHRVAYLAFTEPQRFRPDKMLVVVPHDALRHYVARVLPSLGLEGVTITTFDRIAHRMMPTSFPKLPTLINKDTPPVVSRIKSSGALLRAIEKVGAEVDVTISRRIRETMAKWPSGEVVVRAYETTKGTPEERLRLLGNWAAGKGPGITEKAFADLPPVTRSTFESLLGEVRRLARDVVGVWDELLTSKEKLVEILGNTLAPNQIDRVHEWCVRQARIRAEKDRDGEVPTLDSEDAPILLRLWQVMRGPLTAPDGTAIRFAHVFIDEVQDASPISLRVLLDLANKEQSITLAGDIAQRMLDDGDERGEFDWRGLLDELGKNSTTLEPLKVSYRSTAEITTFSRAVLGDLAHDEAPIATRNGPSVELFEYSSIGESVAFLADALKDLANAEPHANVALVSRFPHHADVVYEGLLRAEVPNVRRVREQDFNWEPGYDVTDIRQTKGLEFDEVILLETTAAIYPDTAQARHALYVGATRAAHQLWCVTSEKPSPVVKSALEVPVADA